MSSCLTCYSLLVFSAGSFSPSEPQHRGSLRLGPELLPSLSGLSSVQALQLPYSQSGGNVYDPATPLLSALTNTPHCPLSPYLGHFKSPANSSHPKPSAINLLCHMSTSRETYLSVWLLPASTSEARNPGVILAPQQVSWSLHPMSSSPHLHSSPPPQHSYILPWPLHSHQLSSYPQIGLCSPLFKTFQCLIVFRMKSEIINLAHR